MNKTLEASKCVIACCKTAFKPFWNVKKKFNIYHFGPKWQISNLHNNSKLRKNHILCKTVSLIISSIYVLTECFDQTMSRLISRKVHLSTYLLKSSSPECFVRIHKYRTILLKWSAQGLAFLRHTYRLYIWQSKLPKSSFSVNNITEKSQLVLVF